MTYEKYISDCKAKGFKPTMTEKQFTEMMGIPVSQKHEPLEVRPKKKAIVKQKLTVEPKKEIEPKKPKAVTTAKPRQSIRKKPILTEEERKARKRERQKGYYAKKIGREPRKKATPMSLDGWTPEQKRERRLQQARDRRKAKKEAGIKEKPRTAEQRKQRNEYFARYYAEKKHDPDFMAKRAKHQANYRMNSAA